ncbi:TM2 domain-containing protein [Arthrobacter sp. ov407]|uniref:TM2 domain-containing protein n=1 Tax=Arthrobacter sp. ov407 TaxID=1761748 RepID=UPI0008918CE7|nr:TM2 domain-containing protein [Arthrobacter sp. ov407]SDL78799.1 TM2 domain-containing protein [Arthrobacter sp. ov407]
MSQSPNLAPYTPVHGYEKAQQSNKSFLVTWLLSLLVGVLGVDRFYLGKIGTGILKLVTFGGLGIWALIDLILVLANKTRDKQGLPLEGYDKHKKIALIVTAAFLLVSIIINASRAGAASTSATAPVTSTPAAPIAAAPVATAPATPVKPQTAVIPTAVKGMNAQALDEDLTALGFENVIYNSNTGKTVLLLANWTVTGIDNPGAKQPVGKAVVVHVTK